MSFCIVGLKATTPEGKRFRANGQWWSPLVTYARKIAPDITGNCIGWYFNEGDGLDAKGALALAERLQTEIDSGRTERYAVIFKSAREMAPKEPCPCCEATGTGTAKAGGFGAGDPKTDGVFCGRCEGTGYVNSNLALCGFDVECVREFVHFLRCCGGFAVF